MQALIAVGISAGGRQPKAIIAINHTTGEIRSGQIAGLKGFDYCILKFGDAVRSSAELEMTYYEMARKAGINMMESRLLQIEGNKHFLTKRFDRDGDKKQHTQTLAALWPEADSYEKLLWVCRKMRLSENDATEIFRRMVFNVLANNTDDHNKNFTFIMTSNGRWSLAPAYDMTYIFNMGGYLPQQERCLMIRGKITDITKDDILAFASDNGIRKAEAIINDVAKAISSFHTLAVTYGVKDEWIGRVETCLNNHLAEWGLAAFNQVDSYIDGDGHKITNARLEQAYRGNIHLLATIDGHQRKYIIRRGTPLHEEISRMGIVNISPEKINRLVSECLIK